MWHNLARRMVRSIARLRIRRSVAPNVDCPISPRKNPSAPCVDTLRPRFPPASPLALRSQRTGPASLRGNATASSLSSRFRAELRSQTGGNIYVPTTWTGAPHLGANPQAAPLRMEAPTSQDSSMLPTHRNPPSPSVYRSNPPLTTQHDLRTRSLAHASALTCGSSKSQKISGLAVAL